MSSIPLPALSIRPSENPLDQAAKALSIKGMLQQQQTAAIQQAAASNEVASSGIDLQMKQLGLANAQKVNSALADPNLGDEVDEWQKSKGGQDSSTTSTTGPLGMGAGLQLHPLAQFLAEKKGLPLMGPGGALEVSNNLLKSAQDMATLLKTKGDTAKTQLDNYGTQLGNLQNAAAPIFEEQDPAKQADALGTFKNEVLTNPDMYPPELVKRIPTIQTVGDLATMTNYAKMHEQVISDAKNLADTQTAQATAIQKTQAASGIRDANGIFTAPVRAALDTINTYSAIPANMRAGFVNEIKNAPDFDTAQKIGARADAAQESFQRSADARQNALAMKDVAVGQAMATQLVGEDKNLNASLAQTSGIRQLLDMSKGGNQVASNAVQLQFAEHVVKGGGINRFNETELNALGRDLGSYGRQFQAWVDKGFQGSMPPATASDMATILNAEDAVSMAQHNANVNIIQNRFSQIGGGGIKPPAPTAGAVPPAVQNVLANVGPGIHKLSDGSSWLKGTDGSIKPYTP